MRINVGDIFEGRPVVGVSLSEGRVSVILGNLAGEWADVTDRLPPADPVPAPDAPVNADPAPEPAPAEVAPESAPAP